MDACALPRSVHATACLWMERPPMVRARKQALRNGMHLHMSAHIETTSTFAGRASRNKLPWWLHVYKRTNCHTRSGRGLPLVTCGLSGAALRLADCHPEPSVVRVGPSSLLHLARPAAFESAVPLHHGMRTAGGVVLDVLERVKVWLRKEMYLSIQDSACSISQ